MAYSSSWAFWAILSATFAAMTAILAKLGLEEANPDFATLVRTVVILIFLLGFVTTLGKWQDPSALSGRTWIFLLLSGLATGASWLCYFRALKLGNAYQVAPVDKLSVVLVAVLAVGLLGERPAARDWLGILLVAGGVTLLALKR